MAKVSGHGGFWVLEGTPSNVTVHNAEYEADIDEVIDETTDSGSGGVAEGLPIIYKVNSLRMSVAEDDTAFPQALGLTEGEIVSLWLKRGALDLFDKVDSTIVRNVRVTNDQTKARRVQVTCEYGALTRNAVAPA
jgi:hypothetical protein